MAQAYTTNSSLNNKMGNLCSFQQSVCETCLGSRWVRCPHCFGQTHYYNWNSEVFVQCRQCVNGQVPCRWCEYRDRLSEV